MSDLGENFTTQGMQLSPIATSMSPSEGSTELGQGQESAPGTEEEGHQPCRNPLISCRVRGGQDLCLERLQGMAEKFQAKWCSAPTHPGWLSSGGQAAAVAAIENIPVRAMICTANVCLAGQGGNAR